MAHSSAMEAFFNKQYKTTIKFNSPIEIFHLVLKSTFNLFTFSVLKQQLFTVFVYGPLNITTLVFDGFIWIQTNETTNIDNPSLFGTVKSFDKQQGYNL